MKKLTLHEVQKEELDMLKIFCKLCDDLNLTYNLMAGTLLGAIRHKGFIPWDDDIDVSMPRPDYNKLMKLVESNKITINKDYQFSCVDLSNGPSAFLKLINKNIIIDEKEGVDKNLWIDIFPFDGLPDDENHIKKFLTKRFLEVQLHCIKAMKWKNIFKSSKTFKRRLIKILVKPFTIFINDKKLVKKHNKKSAMYDYEKAKYVAQVAWIDPKRFYYEKDKLLEQDYYEFEDFKAKGFKNYDYYLKTTYGDYMKLPPENKRYSHSFDAYFIESKNNK